MNQIPDVLYGTDRPTWLIVGASRGIGLEFVRQLLKTNARIFATVRDRDVSGVSSLWAEAGGDHGKCRLMACDVLSEESIINLITELSTIPNLKIDNVLLNAGVLRYPNHALTLTYDAFAFHLHTNTIGPIITANRLLRSRIPIGKLVFMSSDSGSASRFREQEDGFAAYAASKAALNMSIRHLAAELARRDDDTVVLAMHPGEVSTDMGNIEVGWTVEGIISAEESVRGMLRVIESKGINDSGSFWTWEGQRYPW
ncbi:Short chain dehydrogenase-like protein 20 [Elsinoe fawcettii]|nr:Short chain dehydrogenase-like protein 20 [Elsinoe fawcettii]